MVAFVTITLTHCWLICTFPISPDRPIFFSVKWWIFSYPSILSYVLDAQKNRLIETVLLSTHNICFGLRNKIIIFWLHTLIYVYVACDPMAAMILAVMWESKPSLNNSSLILYSYVLMLFCMDAIVLHTLSINREVNQLTHLWTSV